MYILKNASKNLFRNKGRNILLGIIILAMLTITSVAIIINTTAKRVADNYREQIGTEIYIRHNFDKMKEAMNAKKDYKDPTVEDKMEFAKSKYLKESKIMIGYSAYAPDIESAESGEIIQWNIGGGNAADLKYEQSNVSLISYSANNEISEFKNGTRELTEGKMPKEKNEALISKDLADKNKLKIGDKIKIRDINKEYDKSELYLTISGIYNDHGDSSFLTMWNSKNQIITNLDTFISYLEEGKANNYVYVASGEFQYILSDVNNLEAFTKELRDKGLSEVYDVTFDMDSYNKLIKPVESLREVSTSFLLSILIIGTVVLIILSNLAIRERKYEIGVLRAMGMKKSLVARGLIYESLILIAVCLVVGIGIGNTLSTPVSNMLIQNQLEEKNKEKDNDFSFGLITIGGNDFGKNDENPFDKMDVSLSGDAIMQVSAIAIIIGSLSSVAGLVYVLRYEPIKILSERN